MRRETIVVLVVTLSLAGLAGCSVHKDIEPVQTRAFAPERFTISGATELPDRWWQTFEDTSIDRLVDESLQGNLNLRQAWARLAQARTLIRASGAGLLPSAEYAGSAQRTRTGLPGFNPSTFMPDKTIDQYTATATITYQVDLWKQIDSGLQAAILDVAAGRKDVEASAMTIASSVVNLWFQIAEQRATIALLEQQVQVSEDFLKLVEFRFSQGLTSAIDVFQQRLQVANLRNQMPRSRTTLSLLQHQLAVLLGRDPGQSDDLVVQTMPDLPPLPETGIPAEVLRKRPDVRAAELRLYSADKRVAVAVADKFPRLSLSASGGTRPNDLGDFFDRWFVNIASNIFGPIFDAGRRSAEADRTRFVVAERYYAWRQTVQNAVLEIEDALVNEAGQQQVLEGVLQQLELARKSLQQARSRYVNGLTDYLNVLTALQSVQNLERIEVQQRRTLLSNRVQLYVALGGTWTENLEGPDMGKVTAELSTTTGDTDND